MLYKSEKDGNGASPKETDTVVVHYKGALIDGTQFDSSYDRNEPLTIRLDSVIKGWTEGLKQMKKAVKPNWSSRRKQLTAPTVFRDPANSTRSLTSSYWISNLRPNKPC